MEKSKEDIAKEFMEITQVLSKHFKYKKIAGSYRGEILNFTIELERIMEEYLSLFFCAGNDRKRTVLLDTILCGALTFARKIDICVFIYKDEIEVSDETEDPEYKFSRVKEYLNEIRNLRNAVAHRALKMDGFMNEPLENKFIFQDNFGNKTAKEITKENLQEFIMNVCYCLDFFQQEIDKIKTQV